MNLHKIFFWLLSLIFILAASSLVLADSSSTATLETRLITEADIDNQDGNLTVTQTGFDLSHELKVGGELPLEFSLHYGQINIDDENITVSLPSRLESWQLGIGTKFPVPFVESDRYFLGFDIFPTHNTDDMKWESGAVRVPFRTYLIYKESDAFIIVGGLWVRPEYDKDVLPVIGLIYKPNDKLSFNLASDDPNISYQFTEATKILWEFDYTLEEYEVRRDHQEGVGLEYQDFSTGLGFEHEFNQYVSGHLSFGGVLNRQMRYRDDVGKVTPEAGFYTDFKVIANF